MDARYLRVVVRLALAVAVCYAFILPAGAQTNFNGPGSVFHGVPASVTSFGFGGHGGFHGVPASVTSLGFGSSGFHLHNGFGRPVFVGHSGVRHHRRGLLFPGYFGGTYYVPYAYPMYVMDTGVDDSMEEDYSSGPTVFDRSGPAREPVARPVPSDEDYRAELRAKPETAPAAAPVQQPVPEQPHTVLVFKDGHKQEIVNYAIVGTTLYDLSDGRTRRVALAELDLPATVKQNDDRGIDFQLPVGSKMN
jgi:hypothetical protein